MYGKHGVERWDNMALEMSGLFGRKEIFTDVKEINRDNIVSVLTDALNIHRINRTQIEYLKNYVRGDQPILSRIKEVRPEINFKIWKTMPPRLCHLRQVMYLAPLFH